MPKDDATLSAASAGSPVPFPPYYDRDGITIYNADCRKVLPFLDRFDLLLTDPPYGMGSRLNGGTGRWRKHFGDGAPKWDEATPADHVIGEMIDAADLAIVWGGQFYALPSGRCWLTWNKIIRNWSSSEHELAWTNLDKPNRAFDYSHGQLATEGKSFHPTQKPLPLMRWCLGLVPDAATVLDPFMGSGTTLVAAKLEGRQAVGIEISEKYCEAAANRLSQGTLF
jgi:site-specific DNA-methyltransferase (adenine-specific)